MIKNIIFDFGGVIVTLSRQQAVSNFAALGLTDAEQRLDAYQQGGIFGELEMGNITAEEFRQELSSLTKRELTYDDCRRAWLSFHTELPERNLQLLRQLHKEGYRLILLSNTNPFMMSWAESNEFDGHGNRLNDYFDATYMSYRIRMMKPDPKVFQYVLKQENILPQETLFVDDGPRNVEAAAKLGIHTFCPENGTDWTTGLRDCLT